MYDGQPTNHETVPGLIRFSCTESCPNYCNNDGTWKYYDKSDPANEWRTDPFITLSCKDGKKYGKILSQHNY